MKSDNLLHKRGFVDSLSQTTVGKNKSLPQKKSSEKSVDDYIRAICLTSKVPWLFNDGRLTDMQGRGGWRRGASPYSSFYVPNIVHIAH